MKAVAFLYILALSGAAAQNYKEYEIVIENIALVCRPIWRSSFYTEWLIGYLL